MGENSERVPNLISDRTNTGSNILVEDTLIRNEAGSFLESLHEETYGIIAVVTNVSGTRLAEEYDSATEGGDGLHVIDASGGTSSSDDRIAYVSSPEDLTTIGVEISNNLDRYDEEEDVCLIFDSVSSMLTMMETENVFRFLHVVTGRIRSAEGLGLFGIRPAVHDPQELATVQQLFDGRIEKEEDGMVFRRGGFTD